MLSFKLNQLILISLSAAILISISMFIMIFAGGPFAVGIKFIMVTFLYTFILSIPILYIKKTGIILLTGFILAIIMSSISLIMGVAIFVSAAFSDLINYIFIKKYDTENKVVISLSIYQLSNFLTAIIISNFILGNILFEITGLLFIIIISVIIILTSIISCLMAIYIYEKRIKKFLNSIGR